MKRIAIVLLTLTLTACGGGGSSSPPPPPPGSVTATFTAAAPPAGAGITLTGPAGAQQNTITLDVNAQSLPGGTYAVAFDVDFDSNLLSFAGFANGTFFEQAGPVSYQVTTAPGNSGKVIAGISLQGQPGGVAGGGRIVSLRFNVQNNTGTTALAFSGNTVLSLSAQPVAATWAAGSVQNRR